MEKGYLGKDLKEVRKSASRTSGGKESQAEGRGSAKVLRQESTGLSQRNEEASQAGDTEMRGEWEKKSGVQVDRCSRDAAFFYKNLASTLREWEPAEDHVQRKLTCGFHGLLWLLC